MRIAIIGAGFAGLSVAWHFQQMPCCDITVFEKKGIGGGASGVAAGLIHPYSGEQGRRSLFATEAIEIARNLFFLVEEKIGKPIIIQQGIVRYVQNDQQLQMFLAHCQKYGDVWQDGENRFWIESGMTIDCQRYLEGLWSILSEKGARLVLNEVSNLDSLKDFDLIVVAAGAGAIKFSEFKVLPISVLKGQVLKCRISEQRQLPQASTICKGYIALSRESKTCYVGSTYQRGDLSEDPQPELAKEELFPKISFFFPNVSELTVVDCYAAFRVARSGHYLPIATRVERNIWALTALGSRGLLYHAFFGREMANEIFKNRLF